MEEAKKSLLGAEEVIQREQKKVLDNLSKTYLIIKEVSKKYRKKADLEKEKKSKNEEGKDLASLEKELGEIS